MVERVSSAWRDIKAMAAGVAAFLGVNPSLPVSAVALAVAAAGALGMFDASSTPEQPDPTVVPYASSETPAPSLGPLLITYYLVDSETAAEALLATEGELIYREGLRKNDIEVLLVVDEANEEKAFRAFEAAKRRSPYAQFELVDLR